VFFDFGRESLLRGEIESYKMLLFQGLGRFSSRLEERRLFVEQIVKTYRRSYKVMLDRRASLSNRMLFFLHRMFFALRDVRLFRLLGLADIARLFVLGYVYFINYGPRPVVAGSGRTITGDGEGGNARVLRTKKDFLVTRAMGGIGDLLMMTPGLHELKRKHPGGEIHFAIPKRYFPIFESNPDVTLLDIESDGFDFMRYRRWFNLTDCPAARIEARTAPRVKKGRIEIFARALGVGPLSVRRMDKRPRYVTTPEERAYQIAFWKTHRLQGKTVIGIQVHSDEVYRDYPHMLQLVAALSRDYCVLLFDVEKIVDHDQPNVIKVEGLPMRKAFALASGCDAIVAPDSAFVHLAAALDIPCVALYGPIDGRIRTQHYPKCEYLDVRTKLGCMPCWRNEQLPCKLTNMRTSVCMADITVYDIIQSVAEVLPWKASQ